MRRDDLEEAFRKVTMLWDVTAEDLRAEQERLEAQLLIELEERNGD